MTFTIQYFHIKLTIFDGLLPLMTLEYPLILEIHLTTPSPPSPPQLPLTPPYGHDKGSLLLI